MAIDLKELLIAAQNKIGNSTSSTATKDLIYLLKTATRGDTSIVAFDSDGEFLDSASHVHRMAYHTGKQNLFLLDSDRTWKPINGNAPSGYSFQGSTSGYTSGGRTSPSPTLNIIDKFSFAPGAQNATDVGDLTVNMNGGGAGQSSSVSGYTSGGYPGTRSSVIDKFPFASDGNATDVGDLSSSRWYLSGQSSSANGYSAGGPGSNNVIDKFPFSSDANATDVGDLTTGRYGSSGQSSSTHGYASGGFAPPLTNIIDKFPFSSDANATDVGDLTIVKRYSAGQSSADEGFTSGGEAQAGPPYSASNVIDKFPFSSDANATDVGNLTIARGHVSGQSSTVNGYTTGGRLWQPFPTPPVAYNRIDRFPFSTNANATDIGDLTTGRYGGSTEGQQV